MAFTECRDGLQQDKSYQPGKYFADLWPHNRKLLLSSCRCKISIPAHFALNVHI